MKDIRKTWKLLRKNIDNFYSYNKFSKKFKNDNVFADMCIMLEKAIICEKGKN